MLLNDIERLWGYLPVTPPAGTAITGIEFNTLPEDLGGGFMGIRNFPGLEEAKNYYTGEADYWYGNSLTQQTPLKAYLINSDGEVVGDYGLM
jgi:hypothetical protein